MKRVLLGGMGSLLLISSCSRVRPPAGGHDIAAPRTADIENVRLPAGYRIEVVASTLTFPSGVTFDDIGEPFVVEAGLSHGERFVPPRLVRVAPDGTTTQVAAGKNGPWNGVTFARGSFFVAEGGEKEGGRILRIDRDGTTKTLIEGLPSFGDHHTTGPVVGPDGFVYFGQGTATNSGVVEKDAQHPEFHDVPCRDVTLAGVNFDSADPGKPEAHVTTGAFLPFGQRGEKGQVIPGRVPCSGAILKVPIDGGAAQLVAWGLRNPFGLAFAPDGRLFVTENGPAVRGSRPIWGAADYLWEIQNGSWYGWPDFLGGEPVNKKRFAVPGKEAPAFLLDHAPGTPPMPNAYFGVASSSSGLDFSRNAAFGHQGHAFVAQFGDAESTTAKAPVGFKVVRVDPKTGVIADFAVNAGDKSGPASKVGGNGLERPVACRFDPKGTALYVVDYGVMSVTDKGLTPMESTGVLWKITRERAQ